MTSEQLLLGSATTDNATVLRGKQGTIGHSGLLNPGRYLLAF